jgi:hypothetical protein
LSRVNRLPCAVFAAFATLPLVLSGQTPPSLGKPDAEFGPTFSRVTSIRELRDGRLLVVDERENTLSLIDPKVGVASPVGRTGAGPGEYGYPSRLSPLPGDSTLLPDPRNARFHIITPDGKIGRTFKLAEPVALSLGSRGSVPHSADVRGVIYFEGGSLSNAGGAQPVVLDSAPLMRHDRATATLDTIAWIQLAKGNTVVRPGPNGKGASVIVGAQAYSARDDWAVLPNGGVAVARVRDYHIDWYPAAGNRKSGPQVPYEPVAVTEREKDAWRADLKSRMSPRTAGSVPMQLPEPEWPVAMPPFVWGQMVARPSGEVWVLRSHKASDHHVYDVFTAQGALAGHVALPAKTRLVGFGNGTVYLVRLDEDDLEHLQRYKLP